MQQLKINTSLKGKENIFFKKRYGVSGTNSSKLEGKNKL